MSHIIKFLLGFLCGALGMILALLLIALIRTLLMPKKVSDYRPNPEQSRTDEYAKKLSRMVQYETVSNPADPQIEKFLGFHKVLEELFPLVHKHLEKIEIDGNLLFFWKGEQHDKPIVLMSHQDVVPAEGVWSHEPFSGDIADGKVWGRGASDTKCSVMAFFQAVEELLAAGYTPKQDVYLSSSCTEEHRGSGATKLVRELQRRGVKPFLVCDEGGGIITEPIGGVHGNYAMVGVFEKGQADVRFTAHSTGGHASAPPRSYPITKLAAFVTSVQKKSPFRKEISKEVAAMLTGLAPYADFGMKFLFGNLWLFGPLLKVVMPMVSAQASAMLQTTIAFTMQKGSEGYNVIPQEAYVTANLRFIPHQKVAESVEVLTKLAKQYDIETEVLAANDPSPSLDLNGRAFRLTEKAIAEVFPGLPASPYIVTGATDCRFYNEVCDNCVRFAPVVYGPEQLKGMHGIDENLETNCLPGAVDYYKAIIRLQSGE